MQINAIDIMPHRNRKIFKLSIFSIYNNFWYMILNVKIIINDKLYLNKKNIKLDDLRYQILL